MPSRWVLSTKRHLQGDLIPKTGSAMGDINTGKHVKLREYGSLWFLIKRQIIQG